MITTTLIQKFWAHVFTKSSDSFILLQNAEDKRSPLSISWMRAGIAVATTMVFLRSKGLKKGDRVAILGLNSPEWVITDLAIQSLGGVTVPIYHNSSAEQVNFILNDAQATFTFSNDPKQLEKVKVGIAVNFSEVPKMQENLLKIPHALQSFGALALPNMAVVNELSALKRGHDDGSINGIGSEDLATLIYTSGSSGVPKGCKLTHGNVAASIGGVAGLINLDPSTDRYLSYLPLAHVYERINGMGLCIWTGVPVAFSTIEEMPKNLSVFKPTLLCGVPAVWEKVRNGVFTPKEGMPKVLNRLGLWKPLLNFAFGLKKGSTLQRFFDERLFKPVRTKLGGRLKLLVSGGAPITPVTLHFFNQLGLEILEGYGATETCSAAVSNRPSFAKISGPKNKVGSVGLPVNGTELRIVAEPGEEELGQGEIQLRGPQVFAGYWNLPAETAAAFTADGWFRTGDLGKVDADGFLFISGRMNGNYKTLGGKFVCREKIEAALKPFPIIQYSVPVAHGRKFTTALIFVNTDKAAELTGKKAPAGMDPAAFYADLPEVNKAVEAAIAGANKELEHWERIQYFRIIQLSATVENGIVTETLKIRSKVLLKRFEKEIDELYSQAEARKKS